MNELRLAVCGRRWELDKTQHFAEVMEDYFGQVLEGYWDVKAWGFILDEKDRDCEATRSYCLKEMRATARGIEDRPWWPTHWMLLGGSQRGACGEAASTPSRACAVFVDSGYSCGFKTGAHEGFHMLGLNHSNTMDRDGYVEEYADSGSVMCGSSRDDVFGLHAMNRFHMGLFEPHELRVITNPGTYLLVPPEVPAAARYPREVPYNLVQPPGESQPSVRLHGMWGKYMVSVRKITRHPFAHTWDEPRVEIHFGSAETHRLATLKEGEASNVIPGVSIRHVVTYNETTEIEVNHD